MKSPFLKRLFPVALIGIAVFALAGITGVGAGPDADKPQANPECVKGRVEPLDEYDLVPNENHSGYIATVYKGTRDPARFDAGLRELAATTKVPGEHEFKRRLEAESGGLAVITDVYGGVEDSQNPVFSPRLDEAEVTLTKETDHDASTSEPPVPEETSAGATVGNARNELEQSPQQAGEEVLAYGSGRKLVAYRDGSWVSIWSVEQERLLQRCLVEGRLLASAFSPCGGSLVTAAGEGNLEYLSTIKLWCVATGEGRVIAQILGMPTHFSFTTDGSRLAAISTLNFIGSITRNPEGGNPAERIQTGGSIHVWRVSNGRELLKVDIELPDYSAKLMQFRRAQADDPDFNRDEAAVNALQAAYYEAVRKRVPTRLKFSPDGTRLFAVSESGQQTIIDSRTGKEESARPATSRGEAGEELCSGTHQISQPTTKP